MSGPVLQNLHAARGPHVGGGGEVVHDGRELCRTREADGCPGHLLAHVEALDIGDCLGDQEVAGVPGGAHISLQAQHLGLGAVPGGPQAPGLPVPADNVSLGKRPGTTHSSVICHCLITDTHYLHTDLQEVMSTISSVLSSLLNTWASVTEPYIVMLDMNFTSWFR